jgi:hypothetical protein
MRCLKLRQAVSVGDTIIVFEDFDPKDREVLLSVNRPSEDRFWRRPILVGAGKRVQACPGVEVEVNDPKPGSIRLAIFAPGVPITPGWLWQRRRRSVDE